MSGEEETKDVSIICEASKALRDKQYTWEEMDKQLQWVAKRWRSNALRFITQGKWSARTLHVLHRLQIDQVHATAKKSLWMLPHEQHVCLKRVVHQQLLTKHSPQLWEEVRICPDLLWWPAELYTWYSDTPSPVPEPVSFMEECKLGRWWNVRRMVVMRHVRKLDTLVEGLHAAVENQHVEVVKILCMVDTVMREDNTRTPNALQMAVQANHAEMVHVVCSAPGTDANAQDNKAMDMAIQRECMEVMVTLLPFVDLHADGVMDHFIHLAVNRFHIDALEALCSVNGVDTSACGREDILFALVTKGDVDILRRVCALGDDSASASLHDKIDVMTYTSVHNGNLGIVDFLHEIDNARVLHCVTTNLGEFVHSAVSKGHVHVLKFLYEHEQRRTRAMLKKNTKAFLDVAITKGFASIAKFLCDVCKPDIIRHGAPMSMIRRAIRSKSPDLVLFLMSLPQNDENGLDNDDNGKGGEEDDEEPNHPFILENRSTQLFLYAVQWNAVAVAHAMASLPSVDVGALNQLAIRTAVTEGNAHMVEALSAMDGVDVHVNGDQLFRIARHGVYETGREYNEVLRVLCRATTPPVWERQGWPSDVICKYLRSTDFGTCDYDKSLYDSDQEDPFMDRY